MPPSAPATSAAEEERAPSSKPGRHCGPSPHTTAYSRPTTTPSVRSAAPSSTASSASEPSPNTASTELRDCSQHTPPAACNNARCSPTSPTPSPPTPAATQCHYSPEPQPTERLPHLSRLNLNNVTLRRRAASQGWIGASRRAPNRPLRRGIDVESGHVRPWRQREGVMCRLIRRPMKVLRTQPNSASTETSIRGPTRLVGSLVGCSSAEGEISNRSWTLLLRKRDRCPSPCASSRAPGRW